MTVLLAIWPKQVKAKWPNDTAIWPTYVSRMTKASIRDQILELLDNGMPAAEIARRADVSYDVVNKFKHRTSVVSVENGAKLQRFLDSLESRLGRLTPDQQTALDKISKLNDEALTQAISYLEFLHAQQASEVIEEKSKT